MRRFLLSLIVAWVATMAIVGSALAQPKPEFRLGFGGLAALIPNEVGEPLDIERFNGETGTTLQPTTRGVMVWRKADNVTTFTNGSTTWLLGPFGLQTRPNDVRFDWEGPDSFVTLPAGAVNLSFAPVPDGWVGRGAVQNPRGEALDAEINVVGFGSGGAPIVDAPSLFVSDIPPGSSLPIRVGVPTPAQVGEWRLQVSSWPAAAGFNLFVDVGTTRGLNVSPSLLGAVAALRSVDGGDWLVRVAAEQGVAIRQALLPSSVLGLFDPDSNLVILSSILASTSARARAAVLAHELQHAADAAAGDLPTTSLQCFRFEARAFEREALVWSALWQNDLPPDINPIYAELNDVTREVAHNPEAFATELVSRYRSECGPIS